MNGPKQPNDKIGKQEADIFEKLYGKSVAAPVAPASGGAINTNTSSPAKNEAEFWDKLYANRSPTKSPAPVAAAPAPSNPQKKSKRFFKNDGPAIAVTVTVFLAALALIFSNSGTGFIRQWFNRGATYTQNPPARQTPLGAIVKIIVDQDTGWAASGSGLLFTKSGYILTNAHVVTTPLGKASSNIKVCYSANQYTEVRCDYQAKLIDADRQQDLAVIKVEGGIKEVDPYPIVVQEDDESWVKNTMTLGTEIQAGGFPGIGGNSLTVTRGIVSGYQADEVIFDDGSLQMVPYFIKTDTEINHGNSGGAAFDKDNRYIGITSNILVDEGGKLGYLIYWNWINLYLNHLVFKGALSLPDNQYVTRNSPASEENLWEGIHAFFKEDYLTAATELQKYTSKNSSDSRGWNYLCNVYMDQGDLNNLGKCAERLRNSNPNAAPLSWWMTSYVNSDKDHDLKKAYDSIKTALRLNSTSSLLLSRKAYLELDMDKYDEAEKTAHSIVDIDERNGEAWYYLGLIAMKQSDTETSLMYLERSFSLQPSAGKAGLISDLYTTKFRLSDSADDLYKSLQYRVESLVLDRDVVDDTVILAGQVMDLFESDKASSWESTLTNIAGILKGIEIDKNLLDRIGSVKDDEIVSYLMEKTGLEREKISLAKISSTRYVLNMTLGWMYTLIDDKASCAKSFTQLDQQGDPRKIISGFGQSSKDTNAMVARNKVLYCLCTNKEYTNSIMSACINSR